MQSIADLASALTSPHQQQDAVGAQKNRANRVRWLKLNFTVQAARLQTLKRQKYQHLQEEALLKARGLLKNWENGVVVLTEDLYRRAAGERDAQELMNYTPEALALRFSLRNDPHVLEAVKQLWQIEMARDSLGCIDQRGYAGVFRRVAKSLDENEFKKKQKLDKLLDEDWKRDSKGEPSMSFANFFDSIFELADLWCETIDASDYVEFLERLRDRISQVRHGKRILKPMGKVMAFDADSDEEEEEEEEEDSDDNEPTERSKPKAAAPVQVQPRLLVAKAIRPAPQPQKQPLNLLGKVTRVALTSKAIHNKRGSEVPQVEIVTSNAKSAVVTTSLSEIVVPTATVSSTPSAPSDAANPAPLLPLQSATQLAGMASRQRRASVVTTIRFLDDGFVRSITEGIGSGGSSESHGSNVQLSMPQAAADALAAAASYAVRREQASRPSLAAAAAAALRRSESLQSGLPVTSESVVVREDLASISETVQHHKPQEQNRGSSERMRVITVSTAKRAMLKSIVFTTVPRGSREAGRVINDESQAQDERSGDGEVDMKQSGETATPHSAMQESPSAIVDNKTQSGRTSRGGGAGASSGASTGIAVRVRTGSVFSLDNSSATRTFTGVLSKGPRAGFATAAARARGGLAPISTAGASDSASVFAGVYKANGSKNTVKLNTIAQMIVSQGSDGVDFSDSVVMSSYVMERPNNNRPMFRPPKILGPAAVGKKPPLPVVPSLPKAAHEEGVLRGQRAIPKQVAQLQHQQPQAISDNEPTAKRQMVVVMTKQPETILSATAQPHRYVGHALYSQSQSTPGTPLEPLVSATHGPEGAPEHALRNKAALDLERSQKDHSRAAQAPHEHVYDHTEPGRRQLEPAAVLPYESTHNTEHGMRIQSFAGSKSSAKPRTPPSSKAGQRQQLSMDSLASPWDTFDDDDDDGISGGANISVSSARSLLQPESATEALAKVISKRAASLSSGATRRHRSSSAETVGKRPRSRPSSTDLGSEREIGEIHDDDAEDSTSTYESISPPARSRLLTVASLGGSSVESRYNDQYAAKQGGTRRVSSEELAGMRESISAPVLAATTALELDCSMQPSTSKARSTTSHTKTREGLTVLVRIPSTRATSLDEFELRGEHAVNSPPRSPATRAANPPKKCTCSRSHEPESFDGDPLTASSYPPPRYRLDLTQNHCEGDSGGHRRRGSPDARCALCSHADATIIVNTKRELKFEPRPKEFDVIAQASQEMPKQSEMMRRRHRHTRGKPS